MPTKLDRDRVAELARVQHGVVTREQLEGLGLAAPAIRDRLAAHDLEIVAPSTFIVPGAPRSTSQRFAIAVLSRRRAILSGRSAAYLHDFDGVAQPTAPEITVPATASGRSRVARVRRSQHFSTIGTVVIDGIVTADVPETIFRMAQYVPARRVARFLDSALLAAPECATQLGEIYLRHQGERMKGMAQLRPLLLERLADGHVPAESELEALADRVFAGLPIPSMLHQAPLPWAPTAGRVDRFVPEWGVIIELDGRRWHARTDAFESDRARDNAAVANGYSVLRFTWEMLQTEPERCRELVLAAGKRSPAAESVVPTARNSVTVSTTDGISSPDAV